MKKLLILIASITFLFFITNAVKAQCFYYAVANPPVYEDEKVFVFTSVFKAKCNLTDTERSLIRFEVLDELKINYSEISWNRSSVSLKFYFDGKDSDEIYVGRERRKEMKDKERRYDSFEVKTMFFQFSGF